MQVILTLGKKKFTLPRCTKVIIAYGIRNYKLVDMNKRKDNTDS